MGTTTHRFLLSIGASVGVLALASASLPASAVDPIACGDVITTSTTLTQDLVCSSGNGLEIGANGVVLDLAGFTLSGSPTTGVGVNLAYRDNVVVANGTIEGFNVGVEIQQSTRVSISKVNIATRDRGINIGGGGGHLIEKNVIADVGRDGVRVGGESTGTVVTKNTVTGAVWGISVTDNAVGTVVEKNIATGNENMGVGAFGAPSGTRFLKNVVSTTRDHGIIIGAGAANSYLEKNEVYTSGQVGIKVEDSRTTLIKNIVVNNGGLGIQAPTGVTGSGNLAAGNNGGVDPQCTGVVCLPYI
ncbi:right-handed parallel beta-helix repeat-containing protein [Tessaracoccus sp. MC1627]|uniref:right-handed parallel beta-helix repeat-containing protein n=1 Tax=Tessaracoccus sp. MC1627 TaxID=2760312 RepID=UPI0016005E75|nr:right-handed parallel beta-helix repeat-containing protein [Tessaracoccus sp. MC1627]MBB1511305.1 right-handed parallel beta-helix repeat-containing protein [Tessaracoccus sp. MC1627]